MAEENADKRFHEILAQEKFATSQLDLLKPLINNEIQYPFGLITHQKNRLTNNLPINIIIQSEPFKDILNKYLGSVDNSQRKPNQATS